MMSESKYYNTKVMFFKIQSYGLIYISKYGLILLLIRAKKYTANN